MATTVSLSVSSQSPVALSPLPSSCRSIPGHEVIGTVVSLGSGSKRWKVGDRVGRGWAGGHCFECKACRLGKFLCCASHIVTGLNADGGMAEFMAARWESLCAVPAGMAAAAAAPLLCAGTTTFNSLRRMGLQQGAWVAVQGLGGLGHLAVQFAAKMGYRVIALSSGPAKEAFARRLGALHFVDSSAADGPGTVAAVLQLTGGAGASLVISTSPSGAAMSAVINALGPDGTLLVLGAGADPLQMWAGQLIHNNRVVRGWASGSAVDSEECLEFVEAFGIQCMTETFPLEKAGEGANSDCECNSEQCGGCHPAVQISTHRNVGSFALFGSALPCALSLRFVLCSLRRHERQQAAIPRRAPAVQGAVIALHRHATSDR